jgi:hypothetical protein
MDDMIESDGRTWEQVLADAGGPVQITTDPDELMQLLRIGVLVESDGVLGFGWGSLPTERPQIPESVELACNAISDLEGRDRTCAVRQACADLARLGVRRQHMPEILGLSDEEVTRLYMDDSIDLAMDAIRAGKSTKQAALLVGRSEECVRKWRQLYNLTGINAPFGAALAWMKSQIESGVGPTEAHRQMRQRWDGIEHLPSIQAAFKFNQRLARTSPNCQAV